MRLESLQNQFILYIKHEKRMSSHTVKAYEADLEQVFKYISEVYEIEDLESINHLIIRSWVVSLMDDGMSPRTVNRKITSLKSFYRYLLRHQKIETNPMDKIISPKVAKPLPVFIEKDKMDNLLDRLEFSTDFEGVRDKLILSLFYATGIRLSELVNLKVLDVDLSLSQLKVLGKRNKERIIPYSIEMKTQLEDYISKRVDIDSPFLFVTNRGNKVYDKFVYRLVNNYLAKVTTMSKKSPHVLRHTFATHMLNNGADLNSIKELLGHASLSATQVYTHNSVERLKNIHKQAHPRE